MNVELERIRDRYSRRILVVGNRYDPLAPYNTWVEQEKHASLARVMRWAGFVALSDKSVLEVGCGDGSNLLRLLLLGFKPENLAGNELLEDRAARARRRLPAATRIFLGDASELDLRNQSFDVVFQSTVFSSILDDDFQQKLADRMWDLTKPGGGILWYDYVYSNPANPDVRGVPIKRIRQLFPYGQMKFWRLTLAPPIGRLVTKISPKLYTLFNAFPFLRTHVMCWIKKP